VQQYYLENGQSYWRKKDDQGFPTSGTMIASPDDLDARYSSKYGAGWIGYKLHITETCDPEEPRLITQVTTTVATVPDSNMTEAIQEDLVCRDLSPDTHWVDAGYVNTDNLLSSQEKEIDLLGPARGDSSWQARTEGAMTKQNSSLIGRIWQPPVLRGSKVCSGKKVNPVGGGQISTFYLVGRSASNVRLGKNVLVVKERASFDCFAATCF
jgi:hypothetical protein